MGQASEAVGEFFKVFRFHILFICDGRIYGVAQLFRWQCRNRIEQHASRHNMRFDANRRGCFLALKEHRSHQHKEAEKENDQAKAAKDVSPNAEIILELLDHCFDLVQLVHFIQSLFSL